MPNVLDPVAVASLVPVSRAVSFSDGRLELDSYQLQRIEGDPKIRTVLEKLRERASTGFIKRPTPAAEAIGHELDALKLGTISSGPYMKLLEVDWAPLGDRVTDPRPFGVLRQAVQNGERAFRAMEEDYPWDALGPEDLFISSWREFAFAGFQDLIHVDRKVEREEFSNYVTITLLRDYPAIVERVQAKAQAKVRRAQRRQQSFALCMTALGLGVGAAVGAASAGISKLVIGKLSQVQQQEMAGSMEEMAKDFQTDAGPFAQEIRRTAASLGLQQQQQNSSLTSDAGSGSAPGPAPTPQPPSAGTGTPAPAAQTSTAAVELNRTPLESLVAAIAGFFKRILGRGA